MGGRVSRPRKDVASQNELMRLVYSSHLVASTEEEAQEAIGVIIANALKNNPARGITGILYFNSSSRKVVQVLEGPRHSVWGIYAIISADNRHHSCRVLDLRTGVKNRLWEGFGMTLAQVGDKIDEIEELAMVDGKLPAVNPRGGDGQLHMMRVQYTSVLLAENAEDGRDIISKILETAVAFNSKMRIGGLLCFNPATLRVTQILEGPAPAVLDLFDRIVVDKRHRACTITLQEVVVSKSDVHFHSRWGMLQTETDHADLTDLATRLHSAKRAAALALPDATQQGGGFQQVQVEDIVGLRSLQIDSTPEQPLMMDA